LYHNCYLGIGYIFYLVSSVHISSYSPVLYYAASDLDFTSQC